MLIEPTTIIAMDTEIVTSAVKVILPHLALSPFATIFFQFPKLIKRSFHLVGVFVTVVAK